MTSNYRHSTLHVLHLHYKYDFTPLHQRFDSQIRCDKPSFQEYATRLSTGILGGLQIYLSRRAQGGLEPVHFIALNINQLVY